MTTATSRILSRAVQAGEDAAARTSARARIHCELVKEEKTSCGPGTSVTASAMTQRLPGARSSRGERTSAQTASMSAASTGATGTTADLRMWGALARSWPAVANALADGIPAMVSEGSSMTIANQAPVTSATPIVASGCQRRRSPSVNIAAGNAAAGACRVSAFFRGIKLDFVLKARNRSVLVDDHRLFRSGVRAELGSAVTVVGEAESVDEAEEPRPHTEAEIV